MKDLIRFFSICLFVVLLTAGVSFSDISVHYPYSEQNTSSVLDVTDEDCYTYERILRNGVWWILVYDCDGHLIDEYIESEV